jgi:uncharacterized protein YceK
MKKKTLRASILLVLAMLLLLSGCGARPKSDLATAEYQSYAATELFDENAVDQNTSEKVALGNAWDLPVTYSAATTDNLAGTAPKDVLAGHKVIRDVQADVQTKEFETYIKAVLAKTKALGGYAESTQNQDVGYNDNSLRNALLVLRIPSAQLDVFTAGLSEKGKVTHLNETSRDVTSEYTDVEAKQKALETERDSLLALMEKSGSLEDLLRVQDKLTDVRQELDVLESQLRQMANQIDLSTVTLSVYEVQRIAPTTPEGFWAKTWANLKANLFAIGSGLRSFLGWLISVIPYLIFIAAIATVVVLVLRRVFRKRRAKRAARK